MRKPGKHLWADDRIWPALFGISLLASYFLYALLRIEPQLIYQAQEPVFFFDSHFAKGFLTYPGGISDLLSRFGSQFFYYPWTGAATLVLLFGSIAWSTRWLIRSLSPHRPVLYLHWIPSILLLGLHSDYGFPLVVTLGLLWILLGMLAYVRLASLHPVRRLLLFCVLQTVLYYITAGQAFLFSVMVIGHELLHRRGAGLPLCYALFAALVPYIGASTVFMLPLSDAYTTHLTSFGRYHVGWPIWALYACFPPLLLLGRSRPEHKGHAGRSASFVHRLFHHRSVLVQSIQGTALLVVAAVAAIHFYDKDGKRVLLVDYYARRRDWRNVLAVASRTAVNPDYIQYQANRALYHTGRLCDDLFSFVQHSGGKSLFMQSDMCRVLPLRQSDLFFDLGIANEAEHWAHEAISRTGDSPWNLQRLVEVNLLKGDRLVAAKYLGMLEKTLWHSAWANDHRKYLADVNEISTDPQLGCIQRNMPQSDFLLAPGQPELCLEEMAKNTGNKMAFEYYMTQCLLDGDIGKFMTHLPQLDRFGYSHIPRHFEEALLIFMQLKGLRDSPLPGRRISDETVRKFNDFLRILTKYNRDRKAAYRELLKYRDTYWFYGQYYYKARGS